MESDMLDVYRAGIAIEIVLPGVAEECGCVGIRLRTFGRKLPKNRMVLGSGPTLEGAFYDALGKAEAGRWENLNWAARPWAGPTEAESSRYGL